MICPQCGANNPVYRARCQACGQTLTGKASRTLSRDTGQAGMAQQDNPEVIDWQGDVSWKKQSTPAPRPYRRPVRRLAIADSAPSQTQDDPARPRKPARAEPSTHLTRQEQKVFGGGGDMRHKGRARGVSIRFFAMLGAFILLAGGIAFAAHKTLKGDLFPKLGLSTPTDTGDAENAPLIEQAEVNGQPAHVITFSGAESDFIFIPELKRNYKIIGGVAKITIPDSHWIGDDPQKNDVEAVLYPVLYSEGQKRTDLAPVRYTVVVPSSPVTVLSPAQEKDTMWYSSMYPIKIQVMEGSQVTIAGDTVSDLVNEEGIITYNASISPIGINNIPVYVKTPGHHATTRMITINRPKMQINLELDFTVPETSDTKTTILTGKTEPGAVVTTQPASSGEITVAADGSFSVRVSLSRYGANTVKIISSMPGKEDSVIEHTIQYMPTVDVYSSDAWALNYDDLMANYKNAYVGAKYKCTGIIHEPISSNPQTFYFNVGTASEPKLIVIQMAEGKDVEEGKRYDIYADVTGDYEGYPLLTGRYRFVKE